MLEMLPTSNLHDGRGTFRGYRVSSNSAPHGKEHTDWGARPYIANFAMDHTSSLASPLHKFFQRLKVDDVPSCTHRIREVLRIRRVSRTLAGRLGTTQTPTICSTWDHFRGDNLLENLIRLHNVPVHLGLAGGPAQLRMGR